MIDTLPLDTVTIRNTFNPNSATATSGESGTNGGVIGGVLFVVVTLMLVATAGVVALVVVSHVKRRKKKKIAREKIAKVLSGNA